jgi:hypothetical protein
MTLGSFGDCRGCEHIARQAASASSESMARSASIVCAWLVGSDPSETNARG